MNESIVKSTVLTTPHGFSTRLGGVSTGLFSSLNLGMNRGDSEGNVIKNYDIFFEAAGIKNKAFVCGNQVHGNHVHIATETDLRPAHGPGEVLVADGFVTNLKNVPLVIFTADCTPLLMYDEVNRVIGAIHCGWRSTVADIMKEGVDAMVSLGADPKCIKAATGPSICPKCFEVGEEVIEAVNKLLGLTASDLYVEEAGKPEKYLLNLPGVVRARLIQLGLKPENIEILNECTMEQPSKYWSHRYTGGARGSQANVICME